VLPKCFQRVMRAGTQREGYTGTHTYNGQVERPIPKHCAVWCCAVSSTNACCGVLWCAVCSGWRLWTPSSPRLVQAPLLRHSLVGCPSCSMATCHARCATQGVAVNCMPGPGGFLACSVCWRRCLAVLSCLRGMPIVWQTSQLLSCLQLHHIVCASLLMPA
jgi:hypothetical protein